MKEYNLKVGLKCTDPIKGLLLELLNTRNIQVDESASIFIVEQGCPLPSGKLGLMFELNHIQTLIDVLDQLTKIPEDTNTTIIGKSLQEHYEVISYNQICFFEGRGNNTFCITIDGEYRVKEKLYELENKLPYNRFIRVGKPFIVNIENVKQIVPWFGRRLVIKFGQCKKEIEVSKNYVKDFKDFLGM